MNGKHHLLVPGHIMHFWCPAKTLIRIGSETHEEENKCCDYCQ